MGSRISQITAGGILFASLLLCSACPAQKTANTSSGAPAAEGIEVSVVGEELQAKGMHCGACEMAIETSLYALPGVISVDADFKSTAVYVEYDAQKNSHADVVAAIEKLGYTVEEVDAVPAGDAPAAQPASGAEDSAEGSSEGIEAASDSGAATGDA